ncbi:gluconokinase [Corynebacterium mycetoides]|uniref:Gluconokinase n=1 Tax=Corynebacterium mycetoides TaxID=38302 RepID=A0A1G9PS17_9CORY|nr:gluconokinase [Corynebacterium mycetoides]SDM01576.1 gluconokinase [Corynebacterium mycetoides]
MNPGIPALRVVVMGVSGSGKSTVGAHLAAILGLDYLDGDDLHPRANVEKMASGQPLNDVDRAPWLEAVGKRLAEHPEGLVLGCSALKRAYRDLIRRYAPDVYFVHLVGSFDLLYERMKTRPGHFMPPELLNSQFATLEPLGDDEAGHVFDVSSPPEEIALNAARWLRQTSPE